VPYHLRKLRDIQRRSGLGAAGRQALAALRARIYLDEEHILLIKQLGGSPPATGSRDVEVRVAGAGDADAIAAFSRAHFNPTTRRHVRCFLRNGYRVFLAHRDGEIVALFWWIGAGDDADHPDLVLHGLSLASGEAYGFALFSAPGARGGGTATTFLSGICAGLADEGYERLWGWVLADNLPARWLFRITGFRDAGRMRVRTFGSLVAVTRTGLLVRNLGLRSRHGFGFRRLRREPRRAGIAV
jgi:GNAT superfamily N-acetyltransferase